MQFALDLWGNTVATGTEDGRVLVYDTQTFEKLHDETVSNNCVNSVSFHPYASMLIATSGQRNFDLPDDDVGGDDDTKWTSVGSGERDNVSKSDKGTLGTSTTCSTSNIEGGEKWSELQVYGLHKNAVILKQLYAAYSTNGVE
jgi:WD40 repeat protein